MEKKPISRKRVVWNYFVTLLVLLSLLSQFSTSIAVQAAGSDPKINANRLEPAADSTNCHPGTGWKWSYGGFLPDVALEAQKELELQGLQTTVKARSFGEVDDCGTFRQSAVDFDINFPTELGYDQDQLEEMIYPVLSVYGNPKLGNIRAILSNGNILMLEDPHKTISGSTTSLNGNWNQVVTPVSPQGRCADGLTYDKDRNVSVLFGGDDTGLSRLNDTWEFDGSSWTQISTPNSPLGRTNIDQTLVYDNSRKKIVLFGGLGSGYLNDTWEYDGASWVQINTETAPESRDAHAIVFDSFRNKTVLFGGYNSTGFKLNDTWEYNGAWVLKSPATKPTGRYHHSMAFDERRHVTVLFGGMDNSLTYLDDTWEYDGNDWKQITTLQAPSARDNHSIAYDANRGVVILFGGENGSGVLNDTWEYDGSNWRQITTTQWPSNRKEMQLVFNNQSGKTVFFGGCYWVGGAMYTFKDTWEYVPQADPNPAIFHKKVYVIVNDPLLRNGQTLTQYLGWNDYQLITQQTIDFFKNATDGRLVYDVAYTSVITSGWPVLRDGFVYTEDTYLAVVAGESPPHMPDEVDYNAIVNDASLDICGKANRHEIDEVWYYGGPYYGFYESTLVGPGGYLFNSSPVPEPYACNRLIPIMGPSFERSIAEAIENFGHRTEATMTRVYGSWEQNSVAHNWDRYALVKALSSNFDYSGCGDIHYPPNGTKDYDWGNISTVLSNCDDFYNYPNLEDPEVAAQPVACTTWNCKTPDYFNYWFNHLPSTTGCDADNVANDWWRYFVEPALANDPVSACSSKLTINYSRGAPGSYFAVTGTDFPADNNTLIIMNGTTLSDTLVTDAKGNLSFMIYTPDVTPEAYIFSLTLDPSVSGFFEIAQNLVIRPPAGNSVIVTIPKNLEPIQRIFFPCLLNYWTLAFFEKG